MNNSMNHPRKNAPPRSKISPFLVGFFVTLSFALVLIGFVLLGQYRSAKNDPEPPLDTFPDTPTTVPISSPTEPADPTGTTKPPQTDESDEPKEPSKTGGPDISVDDRVSDPHYFDDVLFIGDSRTAGLYLYGNISGASFYARSSMNVFNMFDENGKSECDTAGQNLTNYLKSHQFGKIYILLGINDVGYAFDKVIAKYQENLQRISALQPQAILVIQANMHVTKAKSDSSPNLFNNRRINDLNARLSAFADNQKIFYVENCDALDDGSGNLKSEYSGDGVHLRAKYYTIWRDYLLKDGKR